MYLGACGDFSFFLRIISDNSQLRAHIGYFRGGLTYSPRNPPRLIKDLRRSRDHNSVVPKWGR